MAALTGTTDSYTAIGQAEDVHDMIYDISPTKTPVLSMAQRLKATAKNHQWQTDALASAALNAQIEGDDATYASASPTTMLSNRTMISRKTLMVSGTLDEVKKYGRAREKARLVVKYGKELKRDIEVAFVGQQASSAGGAGTARQAAGLRAMIANVAYGNGGTNAGATQPGYASGDWGASTDGTSTSQVTLTSTGLDAALEAAWTDGGEPTTLIVNSKQKQRIAQFSGAAAYAGFYNPNQGKEQGAVINGVDVYISHYGSHKVVLDHHMGQTGVLCLDPDYFGIAWLRPIRTVPLAKTGDAEKEMLIGEYTFVAQNPDAHAQVKALLQT